MTTALFTHPVCLKHETQAGHPESPERLAAVLERLADPEFDGVLRREAPLADRGQISRAHGIPYMNSVLDAVPEEGIVEIAIDTTLSPFSGQAIMRAAGAVCAAVDAVAGGDVNNAFCAVRPPGHHAGKSQAMGFCVFNNVAVGVHHARQARNFRRIAVIDFDVHHGNGTQAIFQNDPLTFFASTHQWFLFPGTGSREERGVGNVYNVPLKRLATGSEFRQAFGAEILPPFQDFNPDFVFISAGFDAHTRDPLGGLLLEDDVFTWALETIADVAAHSCGGRIVSVLEGGYDPNALAESCAAHLRGLLAR